MSRRRRWLRRLAWGAVAVALCAVGCVSYLGSERFERHLRQLLGERGSALLGEDLHIQALDLTLLPLSLELRGIEVHSRDPLRPGQEIVRIEKVRVERLRFVGARQLEIGHIDISRPVVRLRISNGELRDFPGLQNRTGRQRRPLVRTLIAGLELEGGAVTVSLDRPDLTVDLDGIGVAFSAASRAESAADLTIDDIHVRGPKLEERLSLESGTLTRREDELLLTDYRLTGGSTQLAVDGVVRLSPTDDSGAIIGSVGYDLETVAAIELGSFAELNPALPPLAGRIDLHAVVGGVDADVQVDGDVELLGGRVGRNVLGDADARVRFHDRYLRVERLWLGYAGGAVEGTASVAFGEPTRIAGDLEIEGLQLAEVLENQGMPPPWVMLTIDGTARLDGTFEDGPHLRIDVDLPCRDLHVLDGSYHERELRDEVMYVAGGRVTGQVTVLSDRTLLREMTVHTARSDLDLAADFIYHKPLIMDLRVDATRLDLADVTPIAGVRVGGVGPATVQIDGLTRDLDLRGDLQLADGELYGYPLGALDGHVHWHARDDLEFTGIRARRGQTDYTGDLRLMFGKPFQMVGALDFDDARAEDVVSIFTDALDVQGPFDGHIDVRGPVRELDGSAWIRGRRIELYAERFSAVDAQVSIRDGRFTFRNAYLRKGRGGVYGRGYLDTHGPLDMELFTYAMDLDQIDNVRAAHLPLSGLIDAEVHLWGTVRQPLFHGDIQLRETQYARANLGDSSVDVSLRQGVLRADGTLLGRAANRLTGQLDLRGSGAYDLSLDWRALPLHLLLSPRALARNHVTMVADGHLGASGSLGSEPHHDVDLAVTQFDLERGEQRLRNDGPVAISLHDGQWRVEQLRLRGPGSDLRAHGTIGPGSDVDVGADGTVDLALIDLFVPALGSCEARRTAGAIRLRGKRPSAAFEAWLELEDGSLRTVHFPHALEIDHARLTLRDGAIAVESFEGRLGGGRVEGLAGSSITLLGGKPYAYDVHARCVDCTVRYPSSLPWSRGTADLALRGTVPDVMLEGDIQVEDMTYRDDFNWQSSIVSSVTRRRQTNAMAGADADRDGGVQFGIDLRVHSDEGFGISNNLGQARASGEVRVIGGSRRIGLDGGVATTGGRVRFQGHDFDLSEGTIRFPDPYALDPAFHLVLDTDISSPEQSYAVRYVIDGKLSDVGGMTAVASSEPYLSDADINALLLFGVTTDQLQGAGGGAVLTGVTDIMLGALMEQVREARAEGGAAATQLVPDRIELVPDYDSGQFAGFSIVVGKDFFPQRAPNQVVGRVQVGLLNENYGAQLDLRLAPNLYFVPAWSRRSQRTVGTLSSIGDVGDFSLDVRWVLEAD